MTETLGQRLKKVRTSRRLTLDQAAEATRIRTPYLQALENDDLSAMPSPVQGRGFLRLYAQYLGLDVEAALEEMRQAAALQAESVQAIQIPSDESPSPAPELEAVQVSRWQRLLEQVRNVQAGGWNRDANPEAENTVEAEAPENLPEAADVLVEAPQEPQTASVDSPAVLTGETPSGETLWQSWLDRLKQRFSPLPSMQEKVPAEDELEESQPDAVVQSWQEIFKDIGSSLRARRELLSLTLEEVEQHTRVRTRYLKALEAGQLDELPSPVQTRGMLNNYAAFLDLDAERLLLRFAEGLQTRHRERQPVPTRSRRNSMRLPSFKSFIAGDLIFGLGMIILLVVVVIWGMARILSDRAVVPATAEAPSISDVLLASPESAGGVREPTPTLVLEGVAAALETPALMSEAPTATFLPSDIVQVTVVVVERTWMRVVVDGKVVFEGRVAPGAAYPYEGKDQVEVLTGNGAALQIVHNQQEMGRMGNFGDVVDFIYTRESILTPTATVTPTATATLPPTPTRRPTNTPTPGVAEQ